MKILLLNHYAGSPGYGMEFRPYFMAREWRRAGHDVRIIAASHSHVRGRQPAMPDNRKDRITEIIDGIEYTWVRTPRYEGNGIRRVVNIWRFLRIVWSSARSFAQDMRPDVVIASSTYPMDIYVAHRIARLSRAVLVFEVHDLWPLTPVEIGGMSPRHPFIRICAAAERYAYKHADLVVSMLPVIRRYVEERGFAPRRLAVIENGTTLAEWNEPPVELDSRISDCIVEARKRNHILVGYAGFHGRANALGILLEAARLLKEFPLTFLLVGDGHDKQKLIEVKAENDLANVHFFAPVPRQQIRTFLSRIDMAYLGAPALAIYRFGVSPNKMIDYMMGAVPILYAIDAGNNPVEIARCGLSIPPDDPAALASAIRSLSTMSADERGKMGERGRQYATANHTYEALAERFVAEIEGVRRSN